MEAGHHLISTIVHLWLEVLNWYWIFKWLDLPNLQSITLGDYTFYYSSFEIRGKYVILNIEWIDLPNLQSITLGDYTFYYGLFEIRGKYVILNYEWIDLPNLQSISLGRGVFFYNSFVIRGIYMLLYIVMTRSSKSTINYIIR